MMKSNTMQSISVHDELFENEITSCDEIHYFQL